MLTLFALSSSFAATLEVPVRFRYSEYTGWGEDPVVVDTATNATVGVRNPVTGKVLATSGSVFLQDRLGQGSGEVGFDGDPAGTVRTWAIYLLDVNGERLRAEPEVVDIVFGAGGDATISARAKADIVVRAVRIKKKNVPANVGGSDTELAVTVSGYGTEAAFVGIQEVTADGAPIGDHTDLGAMTASVYASYQELLLDAIVPLDTWQAEFAGTVNVKDVAIAGGAVESGEDLDYTVAVYGPASKDKPQALDTLWFPAYDALAPQKKNASGEVVAGKRLSLSSADEVFQRYDGAMNLVFTGDARAWEISAVLVGVEGAVAPDSDGLVTLDPSDIARGGSATVDAAWTGAPEKAGALEATVYFLDKDKDGDIMDDIQSIGGMRQTFYPTGPSAQVGSEAVSYVGESVRLDDGRAAFRGLALTHDAAGTATLQAEVLGEDFAGVAWLRFDFGDSAFGIIDVPIAVTETTFTLDWTFPSDADGMRYDLNLWVYGATTAPELEVVGDGQYSYLDRGPSEWSAGEDETGSYQQRCCYIPQGGIVVRSKGR